ncbi:antibiotic biosynthesis monooxygenase [Candidatus Epulonipiscium fishelsonii]|uniref:Antibiotic biosynthesis monooxygenase n=1 Tax=Candidatus Epulonipiscium fishelsonii TaxID=77094 RepID=A0ACC8XIC2_9FIRM|nr:antibiotic biosynthesis monooxygenase [Epulopiscium sp. SCG-D08WGA-EpuloA1]
MAKLTIIGRIQAKPDKIELVRKELLKLIPETEKEKGCIQYDLHQDHKDPAFFLFFENWESKDLWQNHMNSEHLKAYLKATEGCIQDFVLNEMTQIG